jgi:hypothetical protein
VIYCDYRVLVRKVEKITLISKFSLGDEKSVCSEVLYFALICSLEV